MNESTSNTVGCPQCHRRFVWKPALADKAVKCTCGKAFKIPSAPDAPTLNHAGAPSPAPPAGTSLKHDDFEMDAPAPAPSAARNCPSCNLPLKPGAAVCLNCGFNLRTGGKVQTKVVDLDAEVEPEILPDSAPAGRLSPGVPAPRSSAIAHSPEFDAPDDRTPRPTLGKSRSRIADALKNREDDQAGSKVLDLYLPIIFLVVGVGLTVVHALQEDETVGVGFLRAGIHLVVKVPLMLGALLFAARLMGISYGPLSIGLLKLAGIAMGPMALADVILGAIMGATLGFGIWLGMFFYIIVAGIPLSFMFDLEMGETIFTLVIIVVLEMFFNIFLLTVLIGMFV